LPRGINGRLNGARGVGEFAELGGGDSECVRDPLKELLLQPGSAF
jgi:hypothetical protein